jgi:autotransporter-associated beta strand protein
MRGKAGFFSRFVVPAVITFDGSNGSTINVGGASRSGTVIYTGSGHTTSRVFNMAGTSGGMTIDASGTGSLVLTSQITASVNGAKTLTLAGSSTNGNSMVGIDSYVNPISLVKAGPGKWILAGTSDHSGSTTILDGIVVLAVNAGSTGAFGTQNSLVTFGDSAEDVSGTVTLLMLEDVTLSKGLLIPAAGDGSTQQVVIGGANTSGTCGLTSSSIFIYAGRDVTLQAATGGQVEFRNQWTNSEGAGAPAINVTIGTSGNTGEVLLTNNLRATGTITIAYGRLHVSGVSGRLQNASSVVIDGSGAELKHTGSLAIAVPVTLTSGTISGSGEIASAVTAGANATLSPGDPVGSQAFSAGLTLASGGAYRWQINNWTGSAGSGFDQLVVSGDDLSITATSGSTFTIKLVGLTSGNVSGAVPNFDNTTSKSFTIATAGTLAGFASNKFTIDASEFTNNNDLDGGTWSLSDSGDDIVLTFTP